MHPDFPHALEEKRPDKISGRKTDSKVSQGERRYCVIQKLPSCMHENNIIWILSYRVHELLVLRGAFAAVAAAKKTWSTSNSNFQCWLSRQGVGLSSLVRWATFCFVCLTSMLFHYSLNYCSFRSRKGPENTLPLQPRTDETLVIINVRNSGIQCIYMDAATGRKERDGAAIQSDLSLCYR